MRTSLEGKQASLEMELHRQDENVAEADMVRREMSNPRTPIIIYTPTIANEVWRRAGFDDDFTPCPATRCVCCESTATGFIRSLQSDELVSSVVRHVKGSERHLSRRINCYVSNAGTDDNSYKGRLADSQCGHRGRRVVVLSGRVTPLTRGRTLAEKVTRASGHRQTGVMTLKPTNKSVKVAAPLDAYHQVFNVADRPRRYRGIAGCAESVRRGTRC